MPSLQAIDIESLLRPIAGENPSGMSLRYEGAYDQIKNLRKEADNLPVGEWATGETKVADWRGVMTSATEALTTKTKDLQIAAWLTEALVKQHGFPGLRDGLRLLRELQERFWEGLYPELEEEDAEFRASPLVGLNASLPLLIKRIPLIKSLDGDLYSWLQWEDARQVDDLIRRGDQEAVNAALEDGKVSGEQVQKAVQGTAREFCEALLEDAQQSYEACEQLVHCCDEKFGPAAPSFSDIRKTIEDCRDLVRGFVKKKREAEGLPALEAASPTGANGVLEEQLADVPTALPTATARTPSGNLPCEPVDRADALRRLEAVAAFFRRTEPHSPVSYLVQRAARWGAMPLEQWLQEVVKSDDVLGHIWETLGIKNPVDGNQ
jgi:type VI secretion system protein ImpA